MSEPARAKIEIQLIIGHELKTQVGGFGGEAPGKFLRILQSSVNRFLVRMINLLNNSKLFSGGSLSITIDHSWSKEFLPGLDEAPAATIIVVISIGN